MSCDPLSLGFDQYTAYRPRSAIPEWVYAAGAAYALVALFPPCRKPLMQLGGAAMSMVGLNVSAMAAPNVQPAAANQTTGGAQNGVVVDAAGAKKDKDAWRTMDDAEKKVTEASLRALLAAHDKAVLMIFAQWCGHCHTMMPHFDVAAASAPSGVAYVFVNAEALPRSAWQGEGKLLDLAYFPCLAVQTGKGEPLKVVDSLEAASAALSAPAPAGAAAAEGEGAMLSKLF